MLKLLIMMAVVTTHAFQMNHFSLRSSIKSPLRAHLTPLRCMAEAPGSLSLRRDAMKVMIGSTTASLMSVLWASFPDKVHAYSETKEELVAQANYIVQVWPIITWIS